MYSSKPENDMSDNNDPISQSLDLTPLQDEKKLPTSFRPDAATDEEQVEADIAYARMNLYDLIEKGQGAVDELLAIADQSQHPRSYEVLSTMIKTLTDTNNDLIAVHEKKKKLKETTIELNNHETVNNNLFVGSTSDLLQMMNRNAEPDDTD